MYKDIVFLDGIDDEYRQSVINFVAEWESLSAGLSQAGYSPVINVSTSGTTGAPKTIEFTKDQAEASARYTGRFFDFKKGEAVLLNLSPGFVAGKLMIVRALVHELTLVVAPLQSDPFENIESLPLKIKLAAFVPYQVEAILANENSKRVYESLENVIIGGGEIYPALELRIKELKNNNYATFGMTETLTHIALRPVDGQTDFYTCLPGIKVSKDDRECLVVKPNNVVQQLLQTNDIVELLDEHRFRWIGRYDNVINSGGIKISPEADEQVIRHLIPSRFYITSKKNTSFGEEPVLAIEGEAKHADELLKQIAVLLPKYHAPRSIAWFHQFEETPSGKIKRKKL